jgi:hypothetical protein
MRFFRSVGVLLVIILAFTAFSAFDCGDGKAVISISISPTTAVILTFDPPSGNTTQTFTASVVYDDQSTGDGTTKVDWESANDAIAYFDENVLMPAAVGTTQVRATAEKGTVVSSWRTVTVRPPFAVLGATASVSDNTIDIGDAVTLTMIASIDEDDDQVQDSTENVTSITTWTVTGGTGAGTIAGNVFTATDDGSITITGSFDDGDVTLSATISDDVTLTVLPPVSVALTASPTTATFTGTGNTTINLTAVPSGGTPDGYTWTTTAGTLGAASTTVATNTLDINWQNAGATITIGVTADFQGVDSMDDATVNVAAAQSPTFTDLTVNGGSVANGGDAGEFAAGESLALVATGSDPDGGTVTFSWAATGGANLSSATGASVTVTQNTPDTTTTVTCTITDNNGGTASQRTFTFDATLAAPELNEMRLRVIGHVDGAFDPDPDQVRLLFEVGNMNPAYFGVTVHINYNGTKVEADGIGEKHPENCFGNDGLNIFRPDLQPADMTYSALSGKTVGGPVFFIDWDVISGSGTAVDFTFNTDGNNSTFVDGSLVNHDADVYTPALGVVLP